MLLSALMSLVQLFPIFVVVVITSSSLTFHLFRHGYVLGIENCLSTISVGFLFLLVFGS